MEIGCSRLLRFKLGLLSPEVVRNDKCFVRNSMAIPRTSGYVIVNRWTRKARVSLRSILVGGSLRGGKLP
eukprot:1864473-Heterocapsa_arctica.AAC.1